MTGSKNMIGAIVGAALIGGAAVVGGVALLSDRGEAQASGHQSPDVTAPILLPGESVAPEKALYDLGEFNTATLFTDTLRASHIARGYIVSTDFPQVNVKVRFQPLEYLHGEPLEQAVVELFTGLNSDLNYLVGREATCAWIVNETNGEMGLAHGVFSLTPDYNGWNPSATVNFYRELLTINQEAGEDLQTALEQRPADQVIRAPMWVRQAWVDTLVSTLGVAGSMAAYHAGIELMSNPTFQGMLSDSQLNTIAGYAGRSLDATHDRGYCYMLLKKYNRPFIDLETAINQIRTEKANILIDHIAEYLAAAGLSDDAVPMLAEIYTNKRTPTNPSGYSDDERANAIIAAGIMGNRKSLATLKPLLGHESTRRVKRELLNTFARLHHADNFKTLLNYLNGGDMLSVSNVQTDNKDSIQLHKRTLLAIAMIDSAESNALIEQAYARTRVPEFKRFLLPLLERNKGWRTSVQLLDLEDDLSLRQLHDHYVRLGVFE